MHKDFYASGFLYHPKTNQILLQKILSETSALWSLIGGHSKKKETEKDCFKRIVESLFDVEVKHTSIHGVYDYFHKELKKNNFVHYARVNKLKVFTNTKKTEFAWFSFKQCLKLDLEQQAKQDIIVLQRVLDSGERKRKGLQTIG